MNSEQTSSQYEVREFQKRQAFQLHKSGILGRMALADNKFDFFLRGESLPIFLSSEHNSLRLFFVSLRTQDTGAVSRTTYFKIGEQAQGSSVVPNSELGIIDQDIAVIEQLQEEAEAFQATVVPTYSLEYGRLES